MKTALFVAAALAAAAALPVPAAAQSEDSEKCYGVANAGMNDCKAGGHDCAGKAEVDQDGESFVLLPKGTCLKIDGGSLEPQG